MLRIYSWPRFGVCVHKQGKLFFFVFPLFSETNVRNLQVEKNTKKNIVMWIIMFFNDTICPVNLCQGAKQLHLGLPSLLYKLAGRS